MVGRRCCAAQNQGGAATLPSQPMTAAIFLDAFPQTRFHWGMMNVFRSRSRLILAAMILLAGGVVFEEWHHAGTISGHHLPHPALALADMPEDAGTEFLMTNKNFAAAVDLWQNPAIPTHVANISYANFVFQSELQLSPLDFDRLATRGDGGQSHALPLTVVDKNLVYALFSLGKFKATLNLTPVKAKPEDLLPTQLKPGLGGSFDF